MRSPVESAESSNRLGTTTIRVAERARGRASLLGWLLYALASIIGLLALAWPLVNPAVASSSSGVSSPGSPMLLSLVVLFSLSALLYESGSAGLGPRAIAAIGVLVATNSVLRFAEVALPGPGGFSPVFFLIILSGYAYGARFGFLTGTLTLALSAVVTGGVGPWLPYQMMAAGWVGLTAGWIPQRAGPGGRATKPELLALSGFAGVWGVLYGIVMTLWFWPYLEAGGAGPIVGGSVAPIAQRFLAFYVTTSLAWDVFRAGGNVLIVLAVGAPVLGALRRFGRRFRFSIDKAIEAGAVPAVETASRRPAAVSPGSGPAPDQSENVAGGYSAATPPADELSWADDEGRENPINPRAWVLWLLSVTALASLTRNPLILVVAGLAVLVVRWVLPAHPDREALPLGRFALIVIPVATVYSFVTAHSGATVVVRLPGSWPIVGGPLSVESAAFGALAGLAICLLLASFATFRRALSARSLVGLIPRAFGALALVGAIALTYVPSVLKQLRAVREAQAIRGHHVNGLRDMVPLAVPLLVGGLERSMNLAESMTARGLTAPLTPSPWGRLAFVSGLLAVAAGWLGSSVGRIPSTAGLTLVAFGLAIAATVLVVLGRHAGFTHYRHTPWRHRDTLTALGALLPVAAILLVPAARESLAFSPYPELAVPMVDPWLAASLLGLAAPALPFPKGRNEAGTRQPEAKP